MFFAGYIAFSGCSKEDSPAAPDAEKTAEAVMTEAAETETAEAALYTNTVTPTITRTPDETATAEAMLTMVGEAEATNTQEAAETATAEAALFTETATATVTPTITVTVTLTMTFTSTPVPKIVFVSNRTGNNDIYIMDADGTNQTQFTTHSADDRYPEWCYERSEIVFASNRNSEGMIYAEKARAAALYIP